MAIHYNPTTVSDGLVLALDAANTRSYGGSGTTWTDVSYRGNNGTLTNGPVFTQEPKLEPFGGAGAVSFDGTGDYLDIGSSTDFAFGTGDFTIEVWVYLKSNTLGVIYSNEVSNSLFLYLDSGNLVVRNYGTINLFDLTGPSLNTWTHIALSRSGTDLRLFFNGVQQGGTVTNSTNWTQNGTEIGAYNNGTQSLNGYLSNLRVVKGTALYTSNFTPKRQPLIPESAPNTVLLTCQKGPIRDRSSSAHAITINGDAKSISGASYFDFDGTNDYVAIASNSNFNLGTGDFAVEIWVYLNDITSNGGFVGIINRHNYSTNTGWGIWKDSGGKFGFWYNASTKINGTTNVSTNSWYHIVATRLGSTITLYVNGVSENSATNSSFTDSSTSLGIGVANVGGAWNDTYPVNGYISNTRVYKGKGLTAAEVKQNYRNTKGRYGL